MPENIILGPMKITQWGECSSIWGDLMKGARTVIGGFEFDLLEIRSILEKYSISSSYFYDILKNYCYIPAEENPDGLDIQSAYSMGESFKAIFDPLASANLNWALIHSMIERANLGRAEHENFEEMQSRLLNQLEIRFKLFAHREEQRAVITMLKEEQKKMGRSWVPFADRIDRFWETAYKVCLDKGYDNTFENTTFQAQSERTIVNLFFMANTEIRWNYLNMVYDAVSVQRKVPQNLKLLSKMMDTLLKALDKIQNASHMNIYENAILQASELLRQHVHRTVSTVSDCRYLMLDIYACQDFLDQLDDLPFFIDNLIAQLLSESTVEEKNAAVRATKDEIELTLAAWMQIEAERMATERRHFKQSATSRVGMSAGVPALSDDAFNATLATISDSLEDPVVLEPVETSNETPRYYVSDDADTARSSKKGGYKTIGHAKNSARKNNMNVYDSYNNYTLVYSAETDRRDTAEISADDAPDTGARKPDNS